MVARSRRYYGALFKVSRGFMQGYLLSPTIFNMVVDLVIRYWVIVLGGKTQDHINLGRWCII